MRKVNVIGDKAWFVDRRPGDLCGDDDGRRLACKGRIQKFLRRSEGYVARAAVLGRIDARNGGVLPRSSAFTPLEFRKSDISFSVTDVFVFIDTESQKGRFIFNPVSPAGFTISAASFPR